MRLKLILEMDSERPGWVAATLKLAPPEDDPDDILVDAVLDVVDVHRIYDGQCIACQTGGYPCEVLLHAGRAVGLIE